MLERTLEAISKVSYPKHLFEVIVVDTASTDMTQTVCLKKGPALFQNFHYVHSERPGLHVGRHRGMAIAKSEVLVYGDDDIRPSATWLSSIAESFQDPQTALVGGSNLPDYECAPPPWFDTLWLQTKWGRVNGHHSLIEFGNEICRISPSYVWGCNFSIRKEALLKAGGFHPDAMPQELLRFRGDGETAVSYAIAAAGLKTIYHPGVSVYHWVSKDRMTLKYLYRRGFAQGVSDSYSHIRKAGGLLSRKRGGVENITGRLKNNVRDLRSLTRSVLRGRPVEFRVHRTIRSAHDDGYRYHQSEVSRDRSLLEWVLRDNYLDESVSPQEEVLS